MKQYSRVSYEVRCQISAFLQAEMSIPVIARLLGFHKSTIYREIKRNSLRSGNYKPKNAHEKFKKRYQKCRRRYVITEKYQKYIRSGFMDGWSPEQISGRLRKDFKKAPSTQTIYNYAYRFGYHRYLRAYGRRGYGRYRARKSLYKNKLNISKRPKIAQERKRIGDWERDTMHTLNGTQILVCTDRKSRFVKLDKVMKRSTLEVGYLTEKLLKEAGRKVYTITNDNGGDFKGKSDLKYPVYFCDPMKPGQRGTVENTIGLLRQYVKRKTDIQTMSKQDFLEYERKLNFRPRKVLGYKTPYEVYYNKKLHWQL